MYIGGDFVKCVFLIPITALCGSKSFVAWADIRPTAVGWQALIHASRFSEKDFDECFKLVLL
jgi:hypothetical protein